MEKPQPEQACAVQGQRGSVGVVKTGQAEAWRQSCVGYKVASQALQEGLSYHLVRDSKQGTL